MASATNKEKAKALESLGLHERARALPALQAEAAAAKEKFKKAQAAEQARQRAAAEELRVLDEDRQQLLQRVKVAHDAHDEIRRALPDDLRKELREAETAERAAEAAHRVALSDTVHGRTNLKVLKERLARFPSGADPKDIRAEVKNMEAEHAKYEAAALKAAEELEVARHRLLRAKADHDSALSAALAL